MYRLPCHDRHCFFPIIIENGKRCDDVTWKPLNLLWSIHSRLPVTKYSNLSPSQKCICSLLPEPLFWMPAWYPFPFFFFSILTTLFNSRSKFAKSLEANGWMELKLWKQGFSIVAWLAFSVKRKMKRQIFKHFLIFVVKHIHFSVKPQREAF